MKKRARAENAMMEWGEKLIKVSVVYMETMRRRG